MQPEVTKNAMVPAGPQTMAADTGGLQTVDPFRQLDAGLNLQRASIDLTTPQGRSDLIRSKGVPTLTGVALAGRDLIIRDWLAHVVTLEDQETGEVYDTLRLVLIAENGETYSTTSPSLIRGWGDVLAAYGTKTFSPPLKVRIKAVQGRKKGPYLSIESVEAEQTPAASKPRK